MSKLFDDSSLAMITSAVKDGRLYSIKPVEQLGSELVTNGDFVTDGSWNGSKTIANGQLTKTSTGLVYQNSIDTSVKEYHIIIDVETKAGAGLTAYLGGTQKALNEGVNTFYMKSGGSNAFVGFNNGSGSVFNSISVKEVLVNGDFTFSRGSNLAATRVDVNGLIEKGRENLLLQSNQFDTTWSSINTTETSGQADKDGGTDAWLISKSASGARVQQAISVTGVQTFSVYAKANASNWIALWTNVGTSYFDLSSGTKGSTGASTTICSAMESVGNGWYRCSLIFNTSISNVRIYPADGDLDTSGTSGSVYIQDAQLEQGLVATDYIETGASTAQAGILEDLPRLDYSGGASCPALLLEPQRSNLIDNSEYLTSGNWGKTQLIATQNKAS